MGCTVGARLESAEQVGRTNAKRAIDAAAPVEPLMPIASRPPHSQVRRLSLALVT